MMTETPPPADGPVPGADGDDSWAAGPGAAAEAAGMTQDAGLAAERERLSRQLRDTRVQLAMTETRLAALEQSSTMRFGRTIANAAKKPWPRGALLPRELYKLWRDRGAPKSGAQNAAAALASAQLADLKGTGGRFLAALTPPGLLPAADLGLALAGLAVPASDGLVVTGALSALGCATLAPDAIVHPLLPHDADVVVEGTGADLVLIQASALLPGEVWAYATDPAAADRGRRLARMIVMARALGKPVLLLRDVPQALMPGIGWLATSCDAVLDGELGVQLARFNPLGINPARPTVPVYAGARDPREAPAVRALLDALTGGAEGAVRLAGSTSWRSLPGLYRGGAVFVTASAQQGREQAASGARVIGPLGSGTSAAAVRAELEAARGAWPLTPAQIRAGLRDIFLADATPARLAALLALAELPAALVSGRQIGVLVSLADGGQAARVADALLSQRLRPAEVIASCPAEQADAVRDSFRRLAGSGVRVTVSCQLPPDTDELRALARLAGAAWLAPWAPGGRQDENYLLDLACARECGQADAVGVGSADYEFVRWLEEPALVRATLLKPGGPAAADWGSHGLRLLTIAGTSTANPVAG
jgi:hypothetical protein